LSWFTKKEDEEELQEELLRARAIFTIELFMRVVGDKFHPDSLTSFYLDKEGNHLFSLEVSMKLDDELAFAKEILGNEIYEIMNTISNP
jgi:hypothetical protein